MYCQIELIPKTYIHSDAEAVLWSFLCSLMRNGQILREYTIIKNGNYFLSVTLPKEDSFDEKYDGVYVRRDRAKVKELFDFRIIPMGENIASQRYCSCQSRPAIEMETYHSDIESPFICCGCGRPIVLYEIPFAENREDHFELQCWQDNFSAMDILWIRCLCDRYTGRQLVDPDSALNKQGRELAEHISRQLGIPVYYNLFDDGSKKIKLAKIGNRICRVCPKCGETMKYAKLSDDYEIDICDTCSLSSNRYID